MFQITNLISTVPSFNHRAIKNKLAWFHINIIGNIILSLLTTFEQLIPSRRHVKEHGVLRPQTLLHLIKVQKYDLKRQLYSIIRN